MVGEYSFEKLMEFLDYLGNKGLMNKNSVSSRKASCNKMLGILDETEKHDLRHLDLDSIATRFNNLNGMNYSGSTLRVYKSRTATAIKDFLRFRENPSNFTLETKPRTNSIKFSKPTAKAAETAQEVSQSTQHPTSMLTPDTISIPIAIRSNCIVQVNGLPIDMSKAEAQKIANVILAMAAIEE